MMPRTVELRSDTFTRPTESMRRAMYAAEVGDDVWGEDPTVHRLEERAAALMGKDAAVFVPSGTQGNLIGILSHTRAGNEVILGDKSHIFNAEAAGTAVVGGLQLRTLPNRDRGRLDPTEVRAALRADDPHHPPTGCIAVENTHNRCGGAALPRVEIQAVADVGRGAGVPVHIDGARIFNAAVALRTSAADLAAPGDSVTFCLSKGLGAPVGSVLCGPGDYIARARRWRKMLGGGMRQAGVLAAAGLVALDENVDRMANDHASARALAAGLAGISGIAVDPTQVETNIVNFDIAGLGLSPDDFTARLAEARVLLAPVGSTEIRAVTSYEVSRDDIDYALDVIQSVAHEALAVTA